ncbi:hypothetical protein ABTN42_21690, partial [Acinetobacter baumannii]
GIVFYPVIQAGSMRFYDFVLFRPKRVPFVGLGNYLGLLQDEVFWISLSNSAIWVVAAVGLQFALGFATALVLNQSFRGRSVARALVIIPWA